MNSTNQTDNDEKEPVHLNEVLAAMPYITKCLENDVYKYTSVILMTITLASTLFGNSLIVISHIRFKEFHKSVIYKLILQVAIADLTLVPVLVTYPVEFVRPEYFHNAFLCLSMRPVFCNLSLSASITFLTFIAIDRFLAVLFPLWHMIYCKKTWVLYLSIGTVWAGAIFASVIIIEENMFEDSRYEGDIEGCPLAWYSVETMTMVSTSFIALTMFLNFILYGCILRRIMKRNSDFNFNSTQKHASKTKLMMLVSIVFSLCWLPFLICQFFVITSPDNMRAKCYREYLFILGFFNSGLNWLFYAKSNKKYQTAFKKLLCSCRNNEVSG